MGNNSSHSEYGLTNRSRCSNFIPRRQYYQSRVTDPCGFTINHLRMPMGRPCTAGESFRSHTDQLFACPPIANPCFNVGDSGYINEGGRDVDKGNDDDWTQVDSPSVSGTPSQPLIINPVTNTPRGYEPYNPFSPSNFIVNKVETEMDPTRLPSYSYLPEDDRNYLKSPGSGDVSSSPSTPSLKSPAEEPIQDYEGPPISSHNANPFYTTEIEKIPAKKNKSSIIIPIQPVTIPKIKTQTKIPEPFKQPIQIPNPSKPVERETRNKLKPEPQPEPVKVEKHLDPKPVWKEEIPKSKPVEKNEIPVKSTKTVEFTSTPSPVQCACTCTPETCPWKKSSLPEQEGVVVVVEPVQEKKFVSIIDPNPSEKTFKTPQNTEENPVKSLKTSPNSGKILKPTGITPEKTVLDPIKEPKKLKDLGKTPSKPLETSVKTQPLPVSEILKPSPIYSGSTKLLISVIPEVESEIIPTSDLNEDEDEEIPSATPQTPLSPKSQISPVVTPKSQVSRIATPKSQISPAATPKTQISPAATPKSQISRTATPKSQISRTATPKSQISPAATPKSQISPAATPKVFISQSVPEIEPTGEVQVENFPVTITPPISPPIKTTPRVPSKVQNNVKNVPNVETQTRVEKPLISSPKIEAKPSKTTKIPVKTGRGILNSIPQKTPEDAVSSIRPVNESPLRKQDLDNPQPLKKDVGIQVQPEELDQINSPVSPPSVTPTTAEDKGQGLQIKPEQKEVETVIKPEELISENPSKNNSPFVDPEIPVDPDIPDIPSPKTPEETIQTFKKLIVSLSPARTPTPSIILQPLGKPSSILSFDNQVIQVQPPMKDEETNTKVIKTSIPIPKPTPVSLKRPSVRTRADSIPGKSKPKPRQVTDKEPEKNPVEGKPDNDNKDDAVPPEKAKTRQSLGGDDPDPDPNNDGENRQDVPPPRENTGDDPSDNDNNRPNPSNSTEAPRLTDMYLEYLSDWYWNLPRWFWLGMAVLVGYYFGKTIGSCVTVGRLQRRICCPPVSMVNSTCGCAPKSINTSTCIIKAPPISSCKNTMR